MRLAQAYLSENPPEESVAGKSLPDRGCHDVMASVILFDLKIIANKKILTSGSSVTLEHKKNVRKSQTEKLYMVTHKLHLFYFSLAS